MADALLFFRTIGTQQAGTPLPENLPADQKLVFTLPEDLLESVSLVYENNIKDAPVSNPSGVRKIKTECLKKKENFSGFLLDNQPYKTMRMLEKL